MADWPGLDSLHHPLFGSVKSLAALFPSGWRDALQLADLFKQRGIAAGSGLPLEVVPDIKHPLPYEARIFCQGEMPTRPENVHDLFNAMIWLLFPEAKAALNRRHFAEIQRGWVRRRGPVRDGLTLFDESGVVVVTAHAKLEKLLSEKAWVELFWDSRQLWWADTEVYIFGHSLLEKGMRGLYPGMTGRALVTMGLPGFFAMDSVSRLRLLDRVVAGAFQTTCPQLYPLPLSGIPGWCPENAERSHYLDLRYYRPPPGCRDGGGPPTY